MRREEQTRAAKEVGVESLVFLGHADGRVEYDLDVCAATSRASSARSARTSSSRQSPVRDLDSHLRAATPITSRRREATVAAVYPDARNPFAHPELLDEGLEPWSVRRDVGAGRRRTPTDCVDVTDQVDRKMRALMCHETQHPDPVDDRRAGPRLDGVHGHVDMRASPKGASVRRSRWSTPGSAALAGSLLATSPALSPGARNLRS